MRISRRRVSICGDHPIQLLTLQITKRLVTKFRALAMLRSAVRTASLHNSNRYSTDETDETEILKQRQRTVPERVARLSSRRNCLLARERFEALVLISV
jgi:hypothetical protein